MVQSFVWLPNLYLTNDIQFYNYSLLMALIFTTPVSIAFLQIPLQRDWFLKLGAFFTPTLIVLEYLSFSCDYKVYWYVGSFVLLLSMLWGLKAWYIYSIRKKRKPIHCKNYSIFLLIVATSVLTVVTTILFPIELVQPLLCIILCGVWSMFIHQGIGFTALALGLLYLAQAGNHFPQNHSSMLIGYDGCVTIVVWTFWFIWIPRYAMSEQVAILLKEETENVSNVQKDCNADLDFEVKLKAHYADSFENAYASEHRSSVATDEMMFEVDRTKRRANTIRKIRSLFGYRPVE